MGVIYSRTHQEAIEDNPQQESSDVNDIRRKEREEDMRRFKEELATKREARKEAIASLNRRIEELKLERDKEKEDKKRLQEMLDRREEESEIEGLQKQVKALKDVAAIGGEMLRIRELQVNDLKEKLKAIEETGVAYEKEVESMRRLKGLYEERAKAMTVSHQMEVERERTRVIAAETKLEIAEDNNRELREAKAELEERLNILDSTVDKNNNEISELRIQLADKREQLYNLTSQMAIINNLFSQILSNPENIDRVSKVLEEHHDLVNHLTEKGNFNDVASVLMKVADKNHVMTNEEQDIASNLSKVWKLLVELLGHHNKQAQEETMPDSCYKSVDTPTGPKLVISVSQTFLRLKDLILEKNSLVKEVGRLRDLNGHLEKRLISQESRLTEVAAELHKTWGIVNKLKSQHRALHTHEQVLRYDLKDKRVMLGELRAKLEDCREMWKMARIKNNQTEKDWILLRKEFAERKQQISSAESGYEESPGDSQDEDEIQKLSDDEIDSPENSEQDSHHQDLESESEVEMETKPIENICSNYDIIALTSPGSEVVSHSFPDVEEHQTKEKSLTLDHSNSTCLSHDDSSDDFNIHLENKILLLPWDETETNDEVMNDLVKNNQILQFPEPNNVQKMEHKQCDVGFDLNQANLNRNPETACSPETGVSSTTSATSENEDHQEIENEEPKKRTQEEILEAREARLKRLEEQCQHLFNKVSHTSVRSDMISNRLLELHQQYGEPRPGPSTHKSSNENS